MTTTERDYAAEMRAVIDEVTDTGPYIPAQAAAEVVEKLRANDPGLLAGWLDAQAEYFVRVVINKRDHSRRGVTNHRAKAGVFATAAEAHESGDSEQLTRFLAAPFTVESGERRALGTLTHDDLLYVESDYRARANENLMRAAFFEALAKKVRKGTVADHFTEQQIAAMFDSMAIAA